MSKTDSGLFRLDLGDFSTDVKHETKPKHIFSQNEVGVFAIDYINYKILVPIEELYATISIDLNGETIRKNKMTPIQKSVKPFAKTNDKFFWASGDAVLMEEYLGMSKYYFDNRFKDFSQSSDLLFVCVMLPLAQPTPKPSNPPTNVEALLSFDRAKVSWRMPHLLDIQGRGAWQNWTYELEIIDKDNNDTKFSINGIKQQHFIVTDLTPDTVYRFRVAAYTKAGYSQYSVEFLGRTLKTAHNRSIIWSSRDGLMQSDILANDIHVLIPHTKLNSCNITNVEWFQDVLYYVCGNSLYSFNLTTNITVKVDVKDSVQAIAIDWIGHRLYWFNPSHQLIIRGDLTNFEPEVLFPLFAPKVDIEIDSYRGFLYFSTGFQWAIQWDFAE